MTVVGIATRVVPTHAVVHSREFPKSAVVAGCLRNGRTHGERKRDGGRDTNEESERKKPARSLSAGREIDCSGPLVVSVSPVLPFAGVLTVKFCATEVSRRMSNV